MVAPSPSSLPVDRVALGIAAALVMAPQTRAAVLGGLGETLREDVAREVELIDAEATNATDRVRRLRARLRDATDPTPASRPTGAPARAVPVSSIVLRARAALGPTEGAPRARLGFRPWRAATTLVGTILRAGPRPDVELDRAAGRMLLAEVSSTLDEATRRALWGRLSEEDARIVETLVSAFTKVARGEAPGQLPGAVPERARFIAAATIRRATIEPAELGALLRGAATLEPTDDASAFGCDLARLDPPLAAWARAQRGRIT